MKTLFNSCVIILTVVLLQASPLTAQLPEEIMLQAYEKAKSIENGYYKMIRRMKYMSKPDTNSHTSECYFRKLPDDDVFGFSFYKPYKDSTGMLTSQLFYTGDELVRTNSKDSSGTVTSRSQWKDHINDIKHNYDFFDPIVSPGKETIPIEFKPKDTYDLELLEEENIFNVPCYHIRIVNNEKSSKNDPVEMLRNVKEYWVSKEDFLIKRYNIAYDMIMNNDTMYQFEEVTLETAQLNQLADDGVPGFKEIPSYITLKDYTPYKEEPPLAENTIAPEWELTSLTGKKVNLQELKGRIVLVDFFYKSCFPCMQALPALQALHEKYESQGVSVIGIDPYDKDADDLHKFLSKRGVTYTVLLSEKELPKQYNVSGYPTMYLIDQEGIIFHAQVGYGEGTEKKLEKIIEKRLK